MLRRQPPFPPLGHDERLLDLTTERGEEEVVGLRARCLCVQGSVGSVFRFGERLGDLFWVQPHSKNMASLRLQSRR
jgi:hypothetical protein